MSTVHQTRSSAKEVLKNRGVYVMLLPICSYT